jgi:hypothetical protein
MKTVLLQVEASTCAMGLANVLFCALDVHFIFFIFSKIADVNSFFTLVDNICIPANCEYFGITGMY